MAVDVGLAMMTVRISLLPALMGGPGGTSSGGSNYVDEEGAIEMAAEPMPAVRPRQGYATSPLSGF